MYRSVKFTELNSNVVNVFIQDLESGNTASDVMTIPGIYENIIEGEALKLVNLKGSINGFATEMLALVIPQSTDAVEDVTDLVGKVLTLPAVASKTVINSYEEELQDVITTALEVVRFYEDIQPGTKFCLPAECFSELPSDVAQTMQSQRKSYVLKGIDNQNIFQTDCSSEVCLSLPPLNIIYNNSECVSTLDILRVTAPLRRNQGVKRYGYKSIYHTPYYKVDPVIKGFVPSDLEWINGYPSNDLLDIQANEKKLMNNLRTLILMDITQNVTHLITGLVLNTPFGRVLSRLYGQQDIKVISDICDDLRKLKVEGLSFDLTIDDIDATLKAGWVDSDVTDLIKRNLKVSDAYLKSLLDKCSSDTKVIHCSNLPFRLDLTDEQEVYYADLLIKAGILSKPMQSFLVDICKKAYSVSWGHTGAAKAITGFVSRTASTYLDDEIGGYVSDMMNEGSVDSSKYPDLYEGDMDDADIEDNFAFSGDSEGADGDNVFYKFDYYVSSDTAARIMNNSLPRNYFHTKATVAQSTEASIVEYWKTVNGELNLSMFLTTAHIKTGDIMLYVEAFIKLLRWGNRKPRHLVFNNRQDIRNIFDLSTGLVTTNTVIVDEADLIKVNGCDYSLKHILVSGTNEMSVEDMIIGFVLEKDYGEVKKSYIASWDDMAEIASSSEKILGEFECITNLAEVFVAPIKIEEFMKTDCQFYLSERNIQEGLKLKLQAKQLSTLNLFSTPNILGSTSYIKSLRNTVIVTIKDRQYNILHNYIKTLDRFYKINLEALKNLSTSADLKKLCEIFGNLYSGESLAQESNEVVAGSTLNKLDFGGSVIDWNEDDLEGKFLIIVDKDRASSLPGIDFTDRQLKSISERLNNRVIMLLLRKSDKLIFCRKNIASNEILLKKVTGADGKETHRIVMKSYSEIQEVINRLAVGKSVTIQKIPAYMHVSLKEFFV